jgi:hypothetical protein
MLLLFQPKSDNATLSWGSWRAALPLNNMLTERLARVARSTDATLESSRFRVTLTAAATFKALLLAGTNVTTAVKWRIRSYLDGDFAEEDIDFDSGWLEPFVGIAEDLEWGDPNWWTQTTPFDDDERRINLIHVFDTEPTARLHWSFEIDDTTNPAGVIDIGRLFMPLAWEPSINYQYGDNSLSFQDNTLRSTTLGGSEDAWRRINPRIFRFGIDYLPETEAYQKAYPLMRTAGFNGEVFVVPDKDDDQFMQQRSFLGRISQMDGIAQVAFQMAGVGFEIKESI